MKMVYSHSKRVICLRENCHCTWTPEEIKNNSTFWKVFGNLVIPYKHRLDHTHNHNK
jgi:ABC-type Mn2+/Zn2+ transport system ATPase subunit